MDAALLEVTGLRVWLPSARGEVEAVRGVDLRIARGETVGLIGESGCGKSMTALALMGLLPDAARVGGSIRFDGHELAGLDDAAMCRLRGQRIAMVFQEPMTALDPLQPLWKLVSEPLRVHRGLDARSARAEALRLLDRVRLPQAAQRLDAHAHQLSGGQRQRVMIAAALACGPQLLIADEPTTALDASLQREVLELLGTLVADAGMALLLISHDLALMARSVARVLVMYAGSVVEEGPAADVLARPAHPYTRGLIAARPRLGAPRGVRLATIPGRVPELADLPAGCPFSDRCGWVIDACHAGLPAPVEIGPGHAARCIRADQLPESARPELVEGLQPQRAGGAAAHPPGLRQAQPDPSAGSGRTGSVNGFGHL